MENIYDFPCCYAHVRSSFIPTYTVNILSLFANVFVILYLLINWSNRRRCVRIVLENENECEAVVMELWQSYATKHFPVRFSMLMSTIHYLYECLCQMSYKYSEIKNVAAIEFNWRVLTCMDSITEEVTSDISE